MDADASQGLSDAIISLESIVQECCVGRSRSVSTWSVEALGKYDLDQYRLLDDSDEVFERHETGCRLSRG